MDRQMHRHREHILTGVGLTDLNEFIAELVVFRLQTPRAHTVAMTPLQNKPMFIKPPQMQWKSKPVLGHTKIINKAVGHNNDLE